MIGSSRNDVQKAWLSSVSQVPQREHDLTEVRAAWFCIDPLDSLLVDKRDTPHEDPLQAQVRERKQAPSACAHATTDSTPAWLSNSLFLSSSPVTCTARAVRQVGPNQTMASPGTSDDPAGQTSADVKVDVGLAPKLTTSSPTGPGPTLSSSSGISRKVTRSATKPTPEGMADAGADLVDSAPIGQNEADAFDTVPHPNEPKGGENSALFEGPDIADARMELEECPPEDPDRVNVLNRLARALFLNFQETGQEAFLLECIDIGRDICRTGPHACFFDVIVPLPGRSPMVEYTYKCNYGNREILCAYDDRLFMCRTGSWSRRAM
jgi:hypothetical protein